MTKRMRKTLVPFAFCAMALVALAPAGCRRDEAKTAARTPQADPPEVYMKDEAFRKALAQKRAERTEILGRREKLLQELEERVAQKRADMPGADDAAVKAALEKDPAWNSLVKRIEDATQAVEDKCHDAMKIVAKRLAPR